MKWIAISGGWRKRNIQVENDVRRTVREIIMRDDGIVSGGALGVDYFATDEALKLDPTGTKIKIFLPTSLETYARHYRTRASEGVITAAQAEALIAQLERLKNANPEGLIENPEVAEVNTETYYARITQIVEAADELMAFHINASAGTQDTITKAETKGIPVRKFEYTI